MLDAKELRKNFDTLKTALGRRGHDYNLDSFLTLDKSRRDNIGTLESKKARQNAVSKEIPKLKQQKQDTTAIMSEMKELSAEIKELEPEIRKIEEQIETLLLNIPNIPSPNTPTGTTEDDNQEIRKWGELPAFDFTPKPHWELGETLGLLDAATAAKTTGSRFMFYLGWGAKLQRAIINLMLNTHAAHGYEEVVPPFVVHARSLAGTGQLPKFAEDLYKLENTDYYLNPTAEVPITNMYREEILPLQKLPINHTAYAPSFRQEAGAAGRDTRGLIRMHQFNKVELVKIVEPSTSYAELENLTSNAEKILQLLELPYRVIQLCTADLGFSSAMTYDLEVWLPSYDRYVEISSCSNFEGFQARRAGIRFRNADGQVEHAHTLNGSGLAIDRTIAAILENYQQADGTIKIPKILQPYLHGAEVIS
ncbi:MAG: serine--tRNA ligase [Defluviitaleaceae bacterium]|nr:serine--tRNA ligase [Defluviitaleaceae bacterium]